MYDCVRIYLALYITRVCAFALNKLEKKHTKIYRPQSNSQPTSSERHTEAPPGGFYRIIHYSALIGNFRVMRSGDGRLMGIGEKAR